MVVLPSGTVTFLFTDLEDSTRLWDEQPTAMQDALARHDAILRDAIQSNAGCVVKKTGDGAHAAFATASDAVGAATAAQRAITDEHWNTPEALRVRIGIHTGPAELRDGDYYGTAVNRAARIMSIAHGGQTVISRATSELVRDAGAELSDLGEHQLRGLGRPEHLFQLLVPGLPTEFPPLDSVDASGQSPALSLPPFACGEEQYTGRQAPLARFDDAWRRAGGGDRQVLLVGGEPGIGKTRFAAEVSRRAFSDGAMVFYGRCDEDTVVPYQPFIEALRPYVAAVSPTELHRQLHGLTGDLSRVFPELSGQVAGPPPPDQGVSGGLDDRYRLFEGVTALIGVIALGRPLLMALDDLQWADEPTLLLLRHVVRGTARCPMLLLGCYRDVEVHDRQPLADLLAHMRRERSTAWIALDGLSEDESEELVRSRAGRPVPVPLVKALHEGTDGNPLFLEEMVRHLQETGAPVFELGDGEDVDLDELDLPDTIRDVVSMRVRSLPPSVHDPVSAAAVVGSTFEASLIAQVLAQPISRVLDALDHAAAAGLVVEDPDRVGRYSFSHTLVRQALYLGMVSSRRTQLHHDVGVVMEEDDRYPAATLAHHFGRSVALDGPARATRYAIAAGRQAAADLAFEDAVRHFEHALELLDRDGQSSDALTRAELLTEHAEALLFVDESAGVDAARRAVEVSREAGSPAQFGRAVAVFVEPALSAAARPDEAAALFDEAMAVLGDDALELRARLLAILAFKYTTAQLRGRDGRALAEAALRAARQAGDPRTLADALLAQAVAFEGQADLGKRFALAEELIALARTAGARPWSYGLGVLAGAQLTAGDADGLAATVAEHRRIGEELRWVPAHVHARRWEATVALLEGRFEDALTTTKGMRRYASAYRGASGIRSMLLFHLSRDEGELADELGDVPLGEQHDNLHGLTLLALAHVDTGHVSAVLDVLEVEGSSGPTALGEPAWPAYLAVLTEAAAMAGDATHAEYLAQQLAPFEGRVLSFPTGLAALGATDRYLGMLAALLARWDEANERFARALELERHARGWALVPRTQYWHAWCLRRRGMPGDAAAARGILVDAADVSSQLGMKRLHAQAAALLSS